MQMPLQHTNENVKTNPHLAGIILPHERLLGFRHDSIFTPPPPVVLLAVQPLYLKVRVEVEDDALRRFRRRDDPVADLVRRVLQWVTGGGDVTGLAGIEDAAALRHCEGGRKRGGAQ